MEICKAAHTESYGSVFVCLFVCLFVDCIITALIFTDISYDITDLVETAAPLWNPASH